VLLQEALQAGVPTVKVKQPVSLQLPAPKKRSRSLVDTANEVSPEAESSKNKRRRPVGATIVDENENTYVQDNEVIESGQAGEDEFDNLCQLGTNEESAEDHVEEAHHDDGEGNQYHNQVSSST